MVFEDWFDSVWSDFAGMFPELGPDEVEKLLEGNLQHHSIILDEYDVQYGEGYYDTVCVAERIGREAGLSD